MGVLQSTIQKQMQRVVRYLQDEDDDDEKTPLFVRNQSDSPKRFNRMRVARLLSPFVVVIVANFLGNMPTRLFHRSTAWDRLEERHLNGRQCIMNLFVDKHEANEFNPDFDPSAEKEHLHNA